MLIQSPIKLRCGPGLEKEKTTTITLKMVIFMKSFN